MRVSVILALPSQEPLRESAAAAFEGRESAVPMSQVESPEEFELDEAFGAVPLGSVDAGFTAREALAVDESKDFAVRGTIEVESTETIPDEVGGRPVFSDPKIAPFPYCAGGAQGSSSDVALKLDVAGLQSKGLDGEDVAIAIVDTGINLAHLMTKLGSPPRFDATNSWRPTGTTNAPGTYPVDHGTMCAYDALIAAPKATLVDYPLLATSAPGGNVTGSTISAAIQAFSHILANYAVAFAPGGAHRYKGLVINNSWGIYHPSWDFPSGHPGRYCDNPNHPFSAIINALTASGIDIVFAAGNCGSDCPDGRCQGRSTGAIMGANAYADVLTVAACLATNDDRLGYSSQGPSMTNMPPEKPDLTAYSHFLGSEAFGVGVADSGTSTACPVTAGCVAALRTKLAPSTHPPQNLFDQLRITSKQPTGLPANWNADFGHGIIQPVTCASTLGL